MNPIDRRWVATILSLTLLLLVAPATRARAHCDGMDGPVVKAAQAALEAKDVRLVLSWVRAADEPEIRSAFERTLAVRGLGAEARGLADTYFFETLVRVHRASEGAPYTGLVPAGRDLGAAIPAADRAIASGDPEPLVKLLVDAVSAGTRERFRKVLATKDHAATDVGAGREFVEQYVTFMHYIERLHDDATRAAEAHGAEPATAAEPHHPEE